MSKTKTTMAEMRAMLRAKTPLLWVVTREESRVEKYLAATAVEAGLVPVYWDCAQGFTYVANGKPYDDTPGSNDPGNALAYISAYASADIASPMSEPPPARQTYMPERRSCFIMRDFHPWLTGAVGVITVRRLANLAKSLPRTEQKRAQAIIILSPEATIPLELQGLATVIDWPLPDRIDMGKILDAALDVLTEPVREKALGQGQRETAIDAAIGLSGIEAQNCYNKSLVQFSKIDATAVAAEKKRVIAREKVLAWHDPLPGGLDSVGGLEVLKAWLLRHANAYTPEARAYGLPAPRGILLIGVPGCGKSMVSKACSTFFQSPLLQWDMNANKSKFVGESEANSRKAIKVIESVGKCVVWIDEIEKALQGAISGSSDGGVSADALGSLLTFMQERVGDSFVIATANDASALPPELLRKGRFDEIFFVDLPTKVERASVLAAALKSHGRNPAAIDLVAVAEATKDFTGAEVAALVPDALFTSYDDGARELRTSDLLGATKGVVPLAVTASEKIAKLRAWAKGRARNASLPDAEASNVLSFESVMSA